MKCEQYESIIAYTLGELPPNKSAQCRAHIETCANCREIYESYASIVHRINDEPELSPTLYESEALSQALTQTNLAKESHRTDIESLEKGLPILIWASMAAFFVVVTILALQMLGRFNLARIIWSIGPAPILLIIVVTIFVTSFLPIAVAAKRRPLNGMTFRK